MSFTQNPEIKREVKTMNEMFARSFEKRNWYILYTAPRAEKVAKRELEFKGYEVFLPMIKTLRVWKNRQKKMIHQVLFPNYIFVHTTERSLPEICQINKVVTYLHCGGKPSKIAVRCIDGIKKMLSMNQELTIEYQEFTEGEMVRIITGPLAGYMGVLTQKKSKSRFGIHLKEINQTVSIEVCSDSVERIVQKELYH